MGKGLFADCGYPDDSRKQDHHSKRKKGKQKDSNRRKDRLSEIELDYVENVPSDENVFTTDMVLNAEDLLKTLDDLNFTPKDSDDEYGAEVIDESQVTVLRTARKNEKTNVSLEIDCEQYQVITFNQLNRDLKLFLKDEEEEIFECSPAPGEVRKYIQVLGNFYRLKGLTVGKSEEGKRVILQKTETTGLPANPRDLQEVIEKGNKAIKWTSGAPVGKKKDKAGSKGGKGKGPTGSSSTKPAPGTIVGHGSSPIDESNVGNILLKKMGWQPGAGLGRDSDGITQPITAVVKAKRQGLI